MLLKGSSKWPLFVHHLTFWRLWSEAFFGKQKRSQQVKFSRSLSNIYIRFFTFIYFFTKFLTKYLFEEKELVFFSNRQNFKNKIKWSAMMWLSVLIGRTVIFWNEPFGLLPKTCHFLIFKKKYVKQIEWGWWIFSHSF